MRWPSVQILLSGLVLLAALALRVADPEPVARLRLSIFDFYQTLSPRSTDESYPVRVIDVDEASLERIGQWPWPRARLAELVDRARLSGARTIAIDLILAEPDRLSPDVLARELSGTPELAPLAERAARLPSNDERLAVALARLPSVLGLSAELRATGAPPPPRAGLAFSGDDPKDFVPRFPGATAPLSVLMGRASAVGAVNWLPSSDQIVRRVPLFVNIAGTLYPSLALEQLRLAEKESTVFVRSSGGSGILAFGQKSGVDSVRVGDRTLPTSADGQMWLKFRPFDTRTYVSAHKLLDGSLEAGGLAGRHVLIGSSATGLLDLRATPLDASVPGVEIHAQALEQMLSGEYLERPAWATGAEIVFLLATGVLVAWLIGRARPLVAAGIGGAAILLVVAASWLAYSSGFLLDPVYPSLALVLLYLTGSLFTYIKTETDRARVRAAFGHYLAPAVVEELARDPSKLKLGGEMREVTVLFADVRGFSKLSEGMPAEELIRLVNGLFTPLTDVILDERGTIDKFMGDAVMAFWNAPAADPEHAGNACRAALRMLRRLEELNAEWAREAGAAGRAYSPVRIGIGLNTGVCCVGNFGSTQRFDYSILGDAVNVASRLEETTKTYGVPIMVGETTMRAAPGLAYLEVGSVKLRGKTRPERLYALLGDEREAASTRFRELTLKHAALISALAGAEKAGAALRLDACRRLGWPEVTPLFDYYAAHVARL